jgi:hypothetical protein
MENDKLKFRPGVKFSDHDSTNNYYLTRKNDGWYVIGHGRMTHVASSKEGREYIRELMELDRLRDMAKGNSGTD